jgi:transposase
MQLSTRVILPRRNKTDPADAAAICEAVSRPSMRFVPIKTETEQAIASVHRVRDRLIGQRTMVLNALRAHMAEFGHVVGHGPAQVKELIAMLAEPGSVPEMLRPVLLGLAAVLATLERQMAVVDQRLLSWHRGNDLSRRLATIPGLGPIIGTAIAPRVLQPQRFRRGRDLSAWLGLVPKQSSSGGQIRLGAISKQGDGYLRRLLINGAQAVLSSKRAKTDPWLGRLLDQAAPGCGSGAGQQNGADHLGGNGCARPVSEKRRSRPDIEDQPGPIARACEEKVPTDVVSRLKDGADLPDQWDTNPVDLIEIPVADPTSASGHRDRNIKGRTHDASRPPTSISPAPCSAGAIHT